jgi:hypothetical protein
MRCGWQAPLVPPEPFANICSCQLGVVPTRGSSVLETGNLTLIRSAAAELPQVSLEDALQVCLAVRRTEPETYERAVVRWLGRFCLERRDVTLTTVRAALEAFERLPALPEESMRHLRRLAR